MTGLVNQAKEKSGKSAAELDIPDNFLAKIFTALPDYIDRDLFVTYAGRAYLSNPSLKAATKDSVLTAIFDCATMGLMPDGIRAAIVARKVTVGKNTDRERKVLTASAQAMVRGIVEAFYRTGKIGSIVVDGVFDSDEFDCYTDTTQGGRVLKHKPKATDNDKTIDKLTKAYGILFLKNGHRHIEVMDKSEILAAKKAASAVGKVIWNGPWWLEMVRKTVLHRLYKRVDLEEGGQLNKVMRNVESEVDLDKLPMPEATKGIDNDDKNPTNGSELDTYFPLDEDSPMEIGELAEKIKGTMAETPAKQEEKGKHNEFTGF